MSVRMLHLQPSWALATCQLLLSVMLNRWSVGTVQCLAVVKDRTEHLLVTRVLAALINWPLMHLVIVQVQPCIVYVVLKRYCRHGSLRLLCQ